MVPRIQLPERVVGEGPRSAFALGRDARSLRIVVDLDSLDEGIEAKLLLGFGAHPDVKMTPLRLAQVTPDEQGGATVEETDDDRQSWTFVRAVSNHVAVAQQTLAMPAEPENWARRMALVCFAELRGVDAFVTQSPELLELARRWGATRSNTMTPSDALALLGLFLRHRSDFTYARGDKWEKHLTRASYYDLHATLLVPHISRWLTRCPLTIEGERRRPRALAEAIITRLSRALRARDGLLAHVLMDTGYEPPDDALLHLDTLLVALRGAFDAAAGITHTAHQPGANVRHPGWSNDGWCRALKDSAPKLKPLLEAGGLVREVFNIVNFLRDFVHAEPFEPVFEVDGREVRNGALLVPSHQDQNKFLASADAEGGRDAWGIGPLGETTYLLRLHTFAERVLPSTAAAIDALCESVDVEHFGVGTEEDERAWIAAMAARAGDAIIPVLALGGVRPRPSR